MFKIKICGVTSVEDAIVAVNAGADAIGLNFYEKSRRCVTPEFAKQVAANLSDAVTTVGVFVNAPLDRIVECSDNGRSLSTAQLHGDESLEAIKEAAQQFDIIRVRRFSKPPEIDELHDELSAYWNHIRLTPDAYLVDAASPDGYGGTGQRLPWHQLAEYCQELAAWKTPLILAGGLDPDNVAEAIRIVRPAAVDVASGVEASSGTKDPYKVRDFIAAAQAAFKSP